MSQREHKINEGVSDQKYGYNRGKSHKSTGQKYGFVHVISSHNALIMNTAGVRVNG